MDQLCLNERHYANIANTHHLNSLLSTPSQWTPIVYHCSRRLCWRFYHATITPLSVRLPAFPVISQEMSPVISAPLFTGIAPPRVPESNKPGYLRLSGHATDANRPDPATADPVYLDDAAPRPHYRR